MTALGLALAFAEWRPAHLTDEQRRAIQRQVDAWEQMLLGLGEQATGFALAWLHRQVFAEPLGDEFDIAITDQLAAHSNIESAGYEIHPQLVLSKGAASAEAFDLQQQWGSQLVKGVSQGIKTQLNHTIGQGLLQGLSRDQIADSLKGLAMEEWRAKLIAQTEAMRSFNRTALGTYADLETSHIKWLDGQVGACASCAKLHGQIIPIGDIVHGLSQANFFHDVMRGFTVQHPPLHPGCRCTIVGADSQEFLDQPNYDDVRYLPPGSVYGESVGIGAKALMPPDKLPPKPKTAENWDADDFANWALDNGYGSFSSIETFAPAYTDFLDDMAKAGKTPFKNEQGVVPGLDLADINATLTAVLASKVSLVDDFIKYIDKSADLTNLGTYFDALDKYAIAKGFEGPLYQHEEFQLFLAKLQNELGVSGLGSVAAMEAIKDKMIAESLPKLTLVQEAKAYIKQYDLGKSYDADIAAFVNFAKKKGLEPFELMEKLHLELGPGASWHNLIAEQAAVKTRAAAEKKAGFPEPTNSVEFLLWYEKHGAGLTGVALSQAYAKATGKTMNAIKLSIESEGYTLAVLAKLPHGAPLPEPVVVPPKKKSTPKPKTKTAPPDPTFKAGTASDVYGAGKAQDQQYWDDAKQTGNQMGSNKGGVFTGPDGQQWYLKAYTRSPLQAQSELLAHKINDMLGIGRPLATIIKKDGIEYYASKLEKGLKQLTPAEWQKLFDENPGMAEKIHVSASLTANWDVAGKTFDNLLWDTVNKRPIVIDAGGSFTFRAQGGVKDFNASADAFETLKNGQNANTSKLFGGLYKTETSVDYAIAATKHLKEQANYFEADAVALGLTFDAKLITKRLDDILSRLATEKARFQPYTGKSTGGVWSPIAEFKAVKDAPVNAFPPQTKYSAAAVKEAKRLARSWSGSAQAENAEAAKAYVQAKIFGGTAEEAYIREAQRKWEGKNPGVPFDPTNSKARWQSLKNTISEEAASYIYNETQQILRQKFPSGSIKLYRGVGDQRKAAVDALEQAIMTTGIGGWDPAGLSSFSLQKLGFGGRGHIAIDVPIEQVFMSTEWMDKNGGTHASEQEYIVISGTEAWQLDFKSWLGTSSAYKKAQTAAGFTPSAYAETIKAYTYVPTEEEELEWHNFFYGRTSKGE